MCGIFPHTVFPQTVFPQTVFPQTVFPHMARQFQVNWNTPAHWKPNSRTVIFKTTLRTTTNLRQVSPMRYSRLFLLLMVLAGTTASAAERPNILFCFADDWGRYASAYAATDSQPTANSVIKTPNFDRVAQQGVLFTNAFVNAPSCTPCRSALVSGRYFFATGRGAILNGAVWDGSVPSFPLILNDAGYHIGETWKVWSPGAPNDAPFGAGKFAYEKAGGAFNGFSQNVTKLVHQGTPLAAAKEQMYAQVRGNFGAFLEACPEDKPFFYWFGPTNVHRTWVQGSGQALWNINPDSLQGKLPKFLPDVPEIREDFADYLGEAQAFDGGVGVLLEQLKAAGKLDNTIVVISGDHGAPGFPGGKCNLYDFGVGVALAIHWPGQPGGRVVDDFVNLMDLCPTFLEMAGAKLPPGMHGQSLVKLLESDQSGQVDPSRNYVVTGRERHVASARAGNLPYPQRSYRTHDFLYIRNFRPERYPMGDPYAVTDTEAPTAQALTNNTRVAFADMDASPAKAWLVAHRQDEKWKWFYDYAFGKRPGEELYDLKKDPDQIKNVADDPAYAAVKAKLGAQLMDVLTSAGDPRVIGDGETFEKPPFTGPENANAGGKKKAR
jgi:arylsulfatase A-like enzyme